MLAQDDVGEHSVIQGEYRRASFSVIFALSPARIGIDATAAPLNPKSWNLECVSIGLSFAQRALPKQSFDIPEESLDA
jgi:hypothetical protein